MEDNTELNSTGDDSSDWFALPGPMSDVIVSTKVCLSRNISNYVFPNRMSAADREKVASLVIDSLKDGYHAARTATMKEKSLALLEERGLRADGGDAVLLSLQESLGDTAVVVNDGDHVHIISFAAGLDVEKAVNKAKAVEEKLQQKVQFAATREEGYLTSQLDHHGSGMTITARVHIPSMTFLNKHRLFVKNLQAEGFDVQRTYRDYDNNTIGTYDAIGAYYDVSTTPSNDKDETEQMADIVSKMKHSAELERKLRRQCTDNRRTAVRDLIVRDCATAKVATLIDEREAVELFSTIKWGVDLGILTGSDDAKIARLSYLIQDAHIMAAMQGSKSILEEGKTFDNDIKDDEEMKKMRVRAIIMNGMLGQVLLKEEK